MVDHYATLGVARGATRDQIRRAYLHKAQALHPDRAGEAADAEKMAEVNEAWRVLGDAELRRRYDASRQPRPRPARPAGPPRPATVAHDPDDYEVPRWVYRSLRVVPWVVLGVVLAGIFVVSAFARSGEADEETRQCVDIAVSGAVEPVSCDEPHDGFVVAVVSPDRVCPPVDRRISVPGQPGVVLCLLDEVPDGS